MQKLCDVVGLPPILCIFAMLALVVGVLGVARVITSERAWPTVTSSMAKPNSRSMSNQNFPHLPSLGLSDAGIA